MATDARGWPRGAPLELGEGEDPRIATGADGFGVIYRQGFELLFQAVSADGEADGAPVHLADDVVGHAPTLVADTAPGAAGFVAAWTGHCADCGFRHHVSLNMARLTADGSVDGSTTVVDSGFVVAGAALAPTEHGVGVAWYHVNRGRVGNIRFTRVTADGERDPDPAREVALTLELAAPAPGIVRDGSGFAVAWPQLGDDNRVHIRLASTGSDASLDLGAAHNDQHAPMLLSTADGIVVAWGAADAEGAPVVQIAHLDAACLPR